MRGAIPTELLQREGDRAHRARAQTHLCAQAFHQRAAVLHERAAAAHRRLGDEERTQRALQFADRARARAAEHEAMAVIESTFAGPTGS